MKNIRRVDFTFKEIVASDKKGDSFYDLKVRGDFNLKGVTKELEVPVMISHLPGKLGSRQGKGEGDLLVLRTEFELEPKGF